MPWKLCGIYGTCCKWLRVKCCNKFGPWGVATYNIPVILAMVFKIILGVIWKIKVDQYKSTSLSFMNDIKRFTKKKLNHTPIAVLTVPDEQHIHKAASLWLHIFLSWLWPICLTHIKILNYCLASRSLALIFKTFLCSDISVNLKF